MQGKKRARTAKSSVQKPTAAQDAGASGTGEGSSNWLSRWRQKQDIRKSSPCRRPFGHSGTDRRRQGGIQWHHCCEVRHGAGHRQRKIGGQHRSQRHCQFCKKQRARSFDRGRFSFAPAAGHVGVFVLFHSVFRHHAGIRADHLHRRGPGHPGSRNRLQEAIQEPTPF